MMTTRTAAVHEYYRVLFKQEPDARLNAPIVRMLAMMFVMQARPEMSAIYAWFSPLDDLVCALDAEGVQVCIQCLQLKPHSDFNRVLDTRNKCKACRGANDARRRETSRAWKAAARRKQLVEPRT